MSDVPETGAIHSISPSPVSGTCVKHIRHRTRSCFSCDNAVVNCCMFQLPWYGS